MACRGEGVGIRGTARGCESDPNTGWGWLVEAAEPLRALAQYGLRDLHIPQVSLDERYAGLSAGKDGTLREDPASVRLARSPPGVRRRGPASTVRRGMAGGPRPLALDVVPQVVQRVAPVGVSLWLSDGVKESRAALLTPCGPWGQRPRSQAPGRSPTPRWLPLPARL